MAVAHLEGAISFYQKERQKGYSNVSFRSVISTLEILKSAVEKDTVKLENMNLKKENSMPTAKEASEQSRLNSRKRDETFKTIERENVERLIKRASSGGAFSTRSKKLSDDLKQELLRLGYTILTSEYDCTISWA